MKPSRISVSFHSVKSMLFQRLKKSCSGIVAGMGVQATAEALGYQGRALGRCSSTAKPSPGVDLHAATGSARHHVEGVGEVAVEAGRRGRTRLRMSRCRSNLRIVRRVDPATTRVTRVVGPGDGTTKNILGIPRGREDRTVKEQGNRLHDAEGVGERAPGA